MDYECRYQTGDGMDNMMVLLFDLHHIFQVYSFRRLEFADQTIARFESAFDLLHFEASAKKCPVYRKAYSEKGWAFCVNNPGV